MKNELRGQRKIAVIGAGIIFAVVLLTMLYVYSGAGQRKLHGLLDLGQRYLDELAYEDAIVVFDEAIEIDPKCERAYMGKAEAQYDLGQYEDSINTLSEGIKEVNDSIGLNDFRQQISGELLLVNTKEVVKEIESGLNEGAQEENAEDEVKADITNLLECVNMYRRNAGLADLVWNSDIEQQAWEALFDEDFDFDHAQLLLHAWHFYGPDTAAEVAEDLADMTDAYLFKESCISIGGAVSINENGYCHWLVGFN